MQSSCQLLGRLKMDDRKAEPLRLLDICQGIVNEQTLRSGPANAIESDLKISGCGFHVTDPPEMTMSSSRSKKSCLWRAWGRSLRTNC